MSDVALAGVVICGVEQANCICVEPPGHALPHKCGRRSDVTPDGMCHGEWLRDDDGRLFVVVYPTGDKTEADAIASARKIATLRTTPRGGIRWET